MYKGESLSKDADRVRVRRVWIDEETGLDSNKGSVT